MRPVRRDRKAKQTVNVSCRIGKAEYDLLFKDSNNKGLSLNSLINNVLKRYLAWEKSADEIGFIPLSKMAIKKIFDSMDEKTINEIAREVGQTIPRELTFLIFNKLDFASIMSMIEIYSTRFGALRHEINGTKHDLTLHHGLNKKFSQYLAAVLEAMAEDLDLKLIVKNADKTILCVEIDEFTSIYNGEPSQN